MSSTHGSTTVAASNLRYLVCREGCDRYVPVEQTPFGAFCNDCLEGDVLIFDHDPVEGQRLEYRVCDDCHTLDPFHLFINTPEGCFCQPCLEERNGEPLPF